MSQAPVPSSRRGFLRSLTTLPLIGGGITLLGTPTTVAEPVTRELLLAYSDWLSVERNGVHEELFPHADPYLRGMSALPMTLDSDNGFYVPPLPAAALALAPASSRAALVLSAVGAEWRR